MLLNMFRSARDNESPAGPISEVKWNSRLLLLRHWRPRTQLLLEEKWKEIKEYRFKVGLGF